LPAVYTSDVFARVSIPVTHSTSINFFIWFQNLIAASSLKREKTKLAFHLCTRVLVIHLSRWRISKFFVNIFVVMIYFFVPWILDVQTSKPICFKTYSYSIRLSLFSLFNPLIVLSSQKGNAKYLNSLPCKPLWYRHRKWKGLFCIWYRLQRFHILLPSTLFYNTICMDLRMTRKGVGNKRVMWF